MWSRRRSVGSLEDTLFQPVFVRHPESWREWWQAVRDFAAGWYGVELGAVRGWSAYVDDIGRSAGVNLPPGIHEWACFASDLEHAGQFRLAMRDGLTLGWVEQLRIFTLLTLGEGDVAWAVAEQHLNLDDPPVDAWMVSGPEWDNWTLWRRHTDSTSLFALESLLAHLHAPGGGFSTDIEPSTALLDHLAALGRSRIQIGPAVLIEGDDLVIRVGPSPWSANPETDYTLQVELGTSRINNIPEDLISLASTGGGSFHGPFAELRKRK
jgi:hypothetical protein